MHNYTEHITESLLQYAQKSAKLCIVITVAYNDKLYECIIQAINIIYYLL